MPKSKSKSKSKQKESESSNEELQGPNRNDLFRLYAKQCEMVGIDINPTIQNALLSDSSDPQQQQEDGNSHNPNADSQLLLGPDISDDPHGDLDNHHHEPQQSACPLIGSGGCRALISAILGETNQQQEAGHNANGDGNANTNNNNDPNSDENIVCAYTAFEEIRIYRENIGDQGTKAISNLLSRSNTNMNKSKGSKESAASGGSFNVKYLELSDNGIGPLGGLALGRSLCCGVSEIGECGVCFLMHCIDSCPHTISNSCLYYAGADACADVGGRRLVLCNPLPITLQMNNTLLTLNLDFNNTFGSEGVTALAKGLKLNSTLKRLSLRFCGIDEKGGEPISDILSFSRTTIQFLNLEGNHLFGRIGLKGLCRGLASNHTLLQLSLADTINVNLSPSSSSIGGTGESTATTEDWKNDDAMECFGRAIRNHASLTEINLMRNIIGDESAMALSKYIEGNTILKSVKVDPSLSSESYTALCRIPPNDKKKKKKKSKKKKK